MYMVLAGSVPMQVMNALLEWFLVGVMLLIAAFIIWAVWVIIQGIRHS